MSSTRSRISLALALCGFACTPNDTPETKPASESAEPAAKLDEPTTPPPPTTDTLGFERVLPLDGSGVEWSISLPISLTPAQESLIGSGPVDLAKAGIDNPFPIGPITLITPTETLERAITWYEIHRTMDHDLLVARLGVQSDADALTERDGLAIFGPVKPVATAKLRVVDREPASAELIGELATAFHAESAKLIAAFEPIDGPEDGQPGAPALTPNATCVTIERPQLPPGFVAIVTVRCGPPEVYYPKLSGSFLLTATGERTPLWGQDWALDYGGTTLSQVIDLDGDGIDELIVHDDGYEFWEVRHLRWDGSHYVPISTGK